MKLLAMLIVLLVANTGFAQCGQTKVFVTNIGFQNSSAVVTNNYGNVEAFVKQTDYIDVVAANGVVVVPAQIRGYGSNSAAVVVPQSTFFFAGNNLNALEFRTREFVQIPGTDQIIASNRLGNEIIINAGIRNSTIQSRGQQLFRR